MWYHLACGVGLVPETVVKLKQPPRPVSSALVVAEVDLSPVKPVKQNVQAILRFTDSADDHVLLSGGSYRFRVQQRTFPSIIACESDAIQDS